MSGTLGGFRCAQGGDEDGTLIASGRFAALLTFP
jgi:hypothetical protein